MLGYFDGVVYEWSLADGVYTIFMSPENYQLFVKNKEGIWKSYKNSHLTTDNFDYNHFFLIQVTYFWRTLNLGTITVSGTVKDDSLTSNTKTLTLTKVEFDEYKTGGYFRGVRYTWTEQNGVYILYISQSSYNMFMQNMENEKTGF